MILCPLRLSALRSATSRLGSHWVAFLVAVIALTACTTAPRSDDGTGAIAERDGTRSSERAGLDATSGRATPRSGSETVESDRSSGAERVDSDLAFRTFDEAWRIVRDTHFDPELGGVDWDAVRDELRPSVATVTTQSQLRGVLIEMLMRTGLSHYGIIPQDLRATRASDDAAGPDGRSAEPSSESRPESAPEASEPDSTDAERSADRGPESDPPRASRSREPGTIGATIRLVDGLPTVTTIEHGGAADRAGIGRGWIIDRIDDRSVSAILGDLEANARIGTGERADDGVGELVAISVLVGMLDRPVGTSVRLELLDAENERRQVRLTAEPQRGESVDLGPLRLSGSFSSRTITGDELRSAIDSTNDEQAALRIGLIGFTVWTVPVVEPFHRAIDDYRSADGIVIDLRGNPGGIGGLVMGIGGHFLDEPRSLGTLRNRQGSLEFRANPRRTDVAGAIVAPYAGPVAILVDGMSGSTSEIFAGGMQSIGRVRVFGSTTAGAALPAVMTTLPNGDTLMHAIADFILPDGGRVEGHGVVPDSPVALTREDLIAGRDPALLAAVRWIVETRSAGIEEPRSSVRATRSLVAPAS